MYSSVHLADKELIEAKGLSSKEPAEKSYKSEKTIAKAAKKNNRKVVLIGQSMKRMIQAAIDNNYLNEVSNFIELLFIFSVF